MRKRLNHVKRLNAVIQTIQEMQTNIYADLLEDQMMKAQGGMESKNYFSDDYTIRLNIYSRILEELEKQYDSCIQLRMANEIPINQLKEKERFVHGYEFAGNVLEEKISTGMMHTMQDLSKDRDERLYFSRDAKDAKSRNEKFLNLMTIRNQKRNEIAIFRETQLKPAWEKSQTDHVVKRANNLILLLLAVYESTNHPLVKLKIEQSIQGINLALREHKELKDNKQSTSRIEYVFRGGRGRIKVAKENLKNKLKTICDQAFECASNAFSGFNTVVSQNMWKQYLSGMNISLAPNSIQPFSIRKKRVSIIGPVHLSQPMSSSEFIDNKHVSCELKDKYAEVTQTSNSVSSPRSTPTHSRSLTPFGLLDQLRHRGYAIGLVDQLYYREAPPAKMPNRDMTSSRKKSRRPSTPQTPDSISSSTPTPRMPSPESTRSSSPVSQLEIDAKHVSSVVKFAPHFRRNTVLQSPVLKDRSTRRNSR